MPNYFLLVEHSSWRGRDEVVKRTRTASFHRLSTSIWDICSMTWIGIEDAARLFSTSKIIDSRTRDGLRCHVRLFPFKTIGTCYGDFLSFISPTFFTVFGWHSVVIKWFVWYGTSKQNGLLFERWMMKRTFVFGFERTETRMPLEICFTPFRFIFFRWVPLEGLLIFLWELGLSINPF